jgi:KipI family sensor histidine kinase inhibitor
VNTFRIVAAGDAAFIVELENRIDPVVNDTAIALAKNIQTAAVPGVRDVVPTYRSVAIHFDPLRTDYDALVARVNAWMGEGPPYLLGTRPPYGGPSPVRVPVCYAGEFGPDLADVAAFAAVSEAEAVRLHTSRIYRVFMLGFMPGFPYMGIVDQRIAAPRLSTPRVRVPVGSVGIAGMQTGIYSVSTPGGWRIIGRTPLKPFDLSRGEPALFKAGDAVQFYAIDPGEYARFESAC